jgi:uncharacterized membrane protein HdeD (DUF308 family)
VADTTQDGKKLSRSFGWLAVLGMILVLAGLVGLVYTGVATLTSMLLFGWLLLAGGAVGLLHAIQQRGSRVVSMVAAADQEKRPEEDQERSHN